MDQLQRQEEQKKKRATQKTTGGDFDHKERERERARDREKKRERERDGLRFCLFNTICLFVYKAADGAINSPAMATIYVEKTSFC